MSAAAYKPNRVKPDGVLGQARMQLTLCKHLTKCLGSDRASAINAGEIAMPMNVEPDTANRLISLTEVPSSIRTDRNGLPTSMGCAGLQSGYAIRRPNR